MKTKFRSALLVFMMLAMMSSFTNAQKKYTPKSYIQSHKETAQTLMRETGIPASVILSIAFHESAYGTSRIANYINNHFGIKGKNNGEKIKSAYKGYASTNESYRDFADMLKRRNSTKPLFDKNSSTDYIGWIRGIAKSGYSTTSDWSRKVIATIDRYNLDQYDEKIELN